MDGKIVVKQDLDERLLEWDAEIITWSSWSMDCANRNLVLQDEDILNAIRYHTTGRAEMSKLEKIIYIADMIEPNRKFDGVEALREIAQKI